MNRELIASEMVKVAERVLAIDDDTAMLLASIPDLSAHLSSFVGTRVVLKVARNDGRYLVLDGDIPANNMGAFASVMSRAYVHVVVTMKAMSDGSYYAGIDLMWESNRGGSNGLDLATAWYQPARGKWLVEKQ